MIDIEKLSKEEQQKLVDFLWLRATERRRQLIDAHLKFRTRYLTIVLEDLYQERNAGAVIRNCDSLGIQDLYVIANHHSHRVADAISKGSQKWIHRQVYSANEHNTQVCINDLKQKGYKVVATLPHEGDYNWDTLPIDRPIALCFGTERYGLSNTLVEQADYFVKIPMHGFSDSLNVSVAMGILSHNLLYRIRNSGFKWELDEDNYRLVKLEWLIKSIEHSHKIIPAVLAM